MSHIFRSYDIRGIYGDDINEEIMKKIGMAFSKHCNKNSIVSRDARFSSGPLASSFIEGASSGIKIFDAGILPLGTGMFQAWKSGMDFAYITGSHLSKEWNGVKFFHSNGIGYVEKEIQEIKKLSSGVASGKKIPPALVDEDIVGNYVKYLTGKIKSSKKMSIAIDNGNGVASLVTKRLFTEAGHDVDMIFEEPDGNFPNRLPDPIDKELSKLKEIVSNYDVGIAYDGDADRMAMVDENGTIVTPEQTSYLILSKILKTEKGPIVANVECTRLIDDIADKFGRKVVRAPVGHTFLMQYTNDHKACFGVEPTGHYCLPSVTPFDDAITISLYAVSVISESEQSLSEMVREIPRNFFERVSFECPDGVKFDAMKNLKENIMSRFENVNTIDGVRVDMANGWALLRVSNTSPYIRLTVEGTTKKDASEIQKKFVEIIRDEFSARGIAMKEEHGKK